MARLPGVLCFDDDLDVPGTEVLVDIDHNLNVPHAGTKDIVLLPQPTKCEGDPLNWTKYKKWWQLFLASAYACVFSFGENTTGDAWDTIVKMTGSTMEIMNGGGALNFLLLGLVNIFWIPIAMKIGRRFCFLMTLLFCIGSSCWTATFTTVGGWYGSNIISGLGTSAYEAIIQLVVFDIFFDHERGRMLGVYIFCMQLGAIIGLVAGGYIADGIGWRWAQWIVAIAEGILFIVFFFTFEETLFPRFLFWKNDLPQSETRLSPTVDSKDDAAAAADPNKDEAIPSEKKTPALSESGSIQEDVADVPSISEFPKQTYLQMLKPWIYFPQDKTSFWTYFKRPFILLGFPNVVIVSILPHPQHTHISLLF